MDDPTPQLIDKLKVYKQQGLTYYQATEQLKQQGYAELEITDAAAQFNYAKPRPVYTAEGQTSVSPQTPPSPKADTEMDRDYQKMGNTLLAEKERGRRPLVYVFWIFTAWGSGLRACDYWLRQKGYHSDYSYRYLWENNGGWILLSGVAAASIAFITLRIHYYRKDKLYKKIDENLTHTPDS